MYDRRSDYALNKYDQDAIVCRNVTGEHVRLTRVDFIGEEEFRKWKAWSDQDYRDAEAAGRGFYDNSLPLDELFMAADSSMEELILEALDRTEHDVARAVLVKQIRSGLTEKQFRRLCMYYLAGMREGEIAALEGVGQQRISRSLLVGKAILEKILKTFLCNKG